uniref:Uncharacterized protein n=1 Tax=Populus trichocarpa TaxID=3694 RepID=A0A3N7FZK0_POPTR
MALISWNYQTHYRATRDVRLETIIACIDKTYKRSFGPNSAILSPVMDKLFLQVVMTM